ncbi:hypothetical protein NDU88_006583 [Pleurodeles waltl]|uniref:Uncharacterized protein n=1 Tax=Pleurodeles waltl TaxID=8319 RepID=A0AAV7NQR4_PLEWA|nr:hypothetical protein NDU88_006583 [Pleurodeles waltl]
MLPEKNPWVVIGGPGARVRPELVQNCAGGPADSLARARKVLGGQTRRPAAASCESAGRERWFDWGRSATGTSRGPGHIRILRLRGRGDIAGLHGPCDFQPLCPPEAIRLGGNRIAEGRERSGPGSGSRADPERKGLALRSVVAGSSGHCGVDCPWSSGLAWWGPLLVWP